MKAGCMKCVVGLCIILFLAGCDNSLETTGSTVTDEHSLYAPVKLPSLDSSPLLVQEFLKGRYDNLKQQPSMNRLIAYGDALFANQYVDEAKKVYDAAFEIEPSNISVISRVSVVLFRMASYDRASKIVSALAEQNPKNIEVVFFDGLIKESLGDYDAALESYQAAWAINRHLPETNFALGKVLFNLGQHEKSAKYLKKAMVLAPDSKFVRAQIVRLSKIVELNMDIPAESSALNSSQLEIPYPQYQEIMSSGRLLPELRLQLGWAKSSGDNHGAIEKLLLIIEHYPDNAQEFDYIDLAHLFAVTGDIESAKGIYNDAVKRFTDSPKALLGLADLEIKANQVDSALKLYDQASLVASVDRDIARVAQGRARCIASKGDLTTALAELKKAERLWPDNPYIHSDMMRVYADMKQFDMAKQHLGLAEQLGHRFSPELKQQILLLAAGNE